MLSSRRNTCITILATLDGVIQLGRDHFILLIWRIPDGSYYSQVFDFVEIDSSLYKTSNAFIVKNWSKKTSAHFRFTAKFPKVITHDKRLNDVEKELELFFSSMIYLKDNILALLIQLTPSMSIVEGMNGLRDIIPELDKRFRYAVEVRDSSYFI